MADFTVQLGSFSFAGLEVPEQIGGGVDQALAVHQFPGGARVIDAIGVGYQPIEWSGRFQGQGALGRYRALEAIATAGLPVTLSWSEFSYLVIVRSVTRRFERQYQIIYSISMEVIADQATTLTPGAGPSLDDMIDGDSSFAGQLASTINNSGLTAAIATMQTAVNGVNSFVTATTAQINAVLLPIAAAQAQVQTLIQSVGLTVASASTLGGILPGNPITTNALALTSQISAMTALPSLYNLSSTLGRMTQNLSSKKLSGTQLTMAGGDLYHVASQFYGDPSGWTGIAKANSLGDPQLTGVQTITVPPSIDGAGGIYTP